MTKSSCVWSPAGAAAFCRVWLLGACLLVLPACPDFMYADGRMGPDNRWHWHLHQVHVGMTRAEVEKFLPPDDSYPFTVTWFSGSFTYVYALDERWSVRTSYERRGGSHKGGFPPELPVDAILIARPEFVRTEHRPE